MAIPQTNYPENMGLGIEGDVLDVGRDAHCRTLTNPAAAMEFGRGVMQSSSEDDDVCTLPTGTAADFKGVTRFSQTGSGDTTSTGIPATVPANILRKGRVRVVAETTVALGDPVYMRFQNAGADPEAIGRFRNDDDGASGDVVRLDDVHAIRWVKSTGSAGSLEAVLELNLP